MMGFLKNLVNRPWKFLVAVISLIVFLFVFLMGSFAMSSLGHAKNLAQAVQSGQSASASVSAMKLSEDFNRLNQGLSIPGIKHLIAFTGLDFTAIDAELRSVIKNVPALAGVDGPKKYFVAFQNSAEARGTGGLIGAFAIIQFDHGKLTVLKTGSNSILKSLNEIPIPMPSEYATLYRSDPAIWLNSNLSPHFPYGAQIWMELWRLQSGEKLDGVIAVDPTAISYILKSTGPITLASGEEITSQNVVQKTLKDAYKRYEKDNNARKQYLVDIMNATFTRLTSMEFSKLTLAKQVVPVLLQNRLLIYSTDPTTQDSLSLTKLGGTMNLGPNNEYRAVILNIDASKLDYYLDREITVKTTQCGVKATTEVSIKVTNQVTHPEKLSAYVLTRADKTKPANRVTGQHRFKVFVYGPNGSTLISASRSSVKGSAGGVGSERTRPLLASDVDLSPKQSEVITATFSAGTGPVTFVDQPLVRPSAVKISDTCKAVSK
jgi:hypothetical protein